MTADAVDPPDSGGLGTAKRKSPMTSPLRSPGASSPISKRQRRSSSGVPQTKPSGGSRHGAANGAGHTAKALSPVVANGRADDQVVLGNVIASPVGQAKADIMKDGGFTPVMSKEEKRKEKKKLKEEKHRKANVPQFLFNTDGFRQGKAIGIAHVRDLILHIVTEHSTPNWIVVQNRPSITHTCCLFVPGILPHHLGLSAPTSTMPFPTSTADSASTSILPIIPRLFSHACPTRAPGDQRKLHSVLNTLMQCPLSDAERKRRDAMRVKKQNSLHDVPMSNSDPRQYLLTPHEMLDNDYPIPDYVQMGDEVWLPGQPAASTEKREENARLRERLLSAPARKGQGAGWVETPVMPVDGGSVPELRVVAMDCEMCKADDLQILARVTLVDCASGKKLYDELCVPEKPVTDYVTQWSGITKEKLDTATLSLPDIQKQLLQPGVIDSQTILLGHSLECDLGALKIRHPLCIDTALLYKHPRGAPFKSALKYLTKQWLGREIQNHGVGGHDSEEDARACMDLLKLKLQHGPDFASNPTETETIFERMSRHAANSDRPGRTAAICDYGNPAQWHGSKAKTAIACKSDEEVMSGMMDCVSSHDFTFGRMMELSNAQGWNSHATPIDTSDAAVDPVTAAFGAFGERLSRLHAALPSGTALIVLTGHSDPRPALELNQRKTRFERLYKTLGADGVQNLAAEDRWSTADDRALEAAAGRARDGMAFFCVK